MHPILVLFLSGLLPSKASSRPGFAEAHSSLLRGSSYDVSTSSVKRSSERALQDEANITTTVTSSFPVIDDTFVRDSAPNRNYNSVANLGVAFGAQLNERMTFLKFDLTTNIDAESILSANLRLRINFMTSGNLTLHVFPCENTTWEEAVITWNNRPRYDNSTTPLATRSVTSEDVNTWLDFDITVPVLSLVAAQAISSTVISFVIEPERDANSSELVKFDSKEDANNVPVLRVVHTVPQTSTPTASVAPTSIATVAPTVTPTVDYSQPEYPQLVALANDGSLQYTAYANEINRVQGSTANATAINTVPDFSNVGYKGGGVPIPFVKVNQTVSPSLGDRRADIQAAIDAVSELDIDASGFRGAVLLEAGDYLVSHPGLEILEGGVVLRGQGQGETNGTRIIFTSDIAESACVTLGKARGGLQSTEPDGVSYNVTDSFVPVGSTSLNITDASQLSVGDRIILQLLPNNDWLVHMSNMTAYDWSTVGYRIKWRRRIKEINGNRLTLDSPVVQAIEAVYGGARVYRYAVSYRGDDVEIKNVGIENIRFESTFADDTDENHGKWAVSMQRVSDGWVRQVTAQYFASGAVLLRRYSHRVTVEDTASLDPKSTLKGGRRYAFFIEDGDLHLVQRCYVGDGRHDFVSGSKTPGPAVFVDSLSVDSYNDIGPHHRFSTGYLYDNIRTNMHPDDQNDKGGEMNVQNRGSDHGWAGAQIMFWNSEAKRFRSHAPNGGMNWAIGMIGEKGAFLSHRIPEPDGIIQSHGNHVTPRSLYYAQLRERVGKNALHSVMLPSQKIGTIWTELHNWAGDGLFGDVIVAWVDEESLPVSRGSPLDIGGMIRDLNLLANSPNHAWSLVTGPGNVTFQNASKLETSATFDTPGTYTLALLVNDDSAPGYSAIVEVSVACSINDDCSTAPAAAPLAEVLSTTTVPISGSSAIGASHLALRTFTTFFSFFVWQLST